MSNLPSGTGPENFAGWEKRYTTDGAKPMVRVSWMDAASSTRSKLPAVIPNSYQPGIVDEVVGFLIGEKDGFLILASSAEPDTQAGSEFREWRGIWDIPKCLVLKVEELAPKELPIARAQSGDSLSKTEFTVTFAASGRVQVWTEIDWENQTVGKTRISVDSGPPKILDWE